MDILDQIGITKEELIDRIVEKALGITADYKQTGEESWDGIPLSSVVNKKIELAIGNLILSMSDKVQTRIDEIMTTKIEAIFTTPFQRTDKWGTAVGAPIAIRDLIYDEASAYWLGKVDDTGKPWSGGYGTSSERAIFYAKKVMTEVYDKELVSTVKTMAEDLKKRIPATIGEEITKTVLKHLK